MMAKRGVSSMGTAEERMNRYPLGSDALAEYAMWKAGFVTFGLGLSNPEWTDRTQVGGALPLRLSGMPDRVVYHDDGPKLMELKGTKGTWRLKLRDINHLNEWAQFLDMDLVVFLWNMDARQWAVVGLDTMIDLHDDRIGQDFKTKAFPDGNKYIEVPWWFVIEHAQDFGHATWHPSNEPTNKNIESGAADWLTMADKREAIG